MTVDSQGILSLSDEIDVEALVRSRGHTLVCGVDEVGRGPLAGPVVAAAVVLPEDLVIEGLDDSKKLSAAQRVRLFDLLAEIEVPCAIGILDNEAIDRMNIHRASLTAMRRAVGALRFKPEFVLVDGRHAIPNLSMPQCAVVGGDSRCQCIAAASIVAKVIRDRIMEEYQLLYPDFTFANHKGYPTPDHLAELREHGATDIHRRSFKPVADLCQQHVLL